jgi:hypothetical protein
MGTGILCRVEYSPRLQCAPGQQVLLPETEDSWDVLGGGSGGLTQVNCILIPHVASNTVLKGKSDHTVQKWKTHN